MKASGTFELVRKPVSEDKVGTLSFSRLSLDKTFSGDLVATSTVEMLAVGSEVTRSAAYVAMERVVGNLGGKNGSFVLIHNGSMDTKSQRLTVTVVSGCSTGELFNLEGKMTIDIKEGKHFYDFQYELNGERQPLRHLDAQRPGQTSKSISSLK